MIEHSQGVRGMRTLAWLTVLLAAGGCREGERNKTPPTPPVPVSVARAVLKNAPVHVHGIGTVEAWATVTIRPQTAGIVSEVHVKEGARVPAGALLFVLEEKPALAVLEQARAALARETSNWKTAVRDAERMAKAFEGKAGTWTELDNANDRRDALAASVKADEAAVEAAKVQLSYYRIAAPMHAVAGDLAVHKGDVVKVNETAMITLRQIRPIYVTFTAPEAYLPEIRARQKLACEKGKADPAAAGLGVEAWFPDTTSPATVGKLVFVQNTVDEATGTIRMKARFENADDVLWPGQFVNVTLTLVPEARGLCVPTQAVQPGQAGRFVFVVRPDNTVALRAVRVEREYDGESLVASGLSAGETVVTDGQLRLRDGSAVQVRSPTTASRPAAGEEGVP